MTPAILSPEKLFAICNTAILPCWLLLIFLPRWSWSQRIATLVAPLLLALAYAWLLVTGPHIPGANFSTLAGIRALFSVDQALVAGWLHYLAFDLFTGSWIARDARRLDLRHWMVVPSMLLTFLFGPVGLASYLLLRAGLRRQFGIVVKKAVTA